LVRSWSKIFTPPTKLKYCYSRIYWPLKRAMPQNMVLGAVFIIFQFYGFEIFVIFFHFLGKFGQIYIFFKKNLPNYDFVIRWWKFGNKENIGWGHSPNQIGGHCLVASKWSLKDEILYGCLSLVALREWNCDI